MIHNLMDVNIKHKTSVDTKKKQELKNKEVKKDERNPI